jgi:hypothetical protein
MSASTARRKFTHRVARAPIPTSATGALVTESRALESRALSNAVEGSAADPTRSASASIHRIR